MNDLTPSVRADGLCLQCEGARLAAPSGVNVTAEQLANDPFCSAACAKSWHGTSLGTGVCSIYHKAAA